MKRLTAILLCVCLVLSLSACAGFDKIRNTELPPLPTMEAPAAETPAPTEAPEETVKPTELVVPENHEGAELDEQIFIYLRQTKELEYAPDEADQPILSFSYVTPTVRIDKNPQAADEINEQLRILDELYYSGSESEAGKNRLYEQALDYYSYAKVKGEKSEVFSSTRSVKCFRADDSVISLLYWTSVFTGGAQSANSYVGRSYSSESGEKITLDQLSSDPELKTKLGSILAAVVHENEEWIGRIAADDLDVDAALAALVRDGNWYFSGEGMVFFPAFGELSEAGEGIDMYTIPYERLYGVIEDKFLAAERNEGGTLEVVRVSDVEDGTVRSIDRLYLDDGDELYLKAVGTLYDVTISSASYYDQQAEPRFFETERYWYANVMTDCALQLSVLLPEGMPNLMISFTDENHELHRLMLSENGQDGTPILVSDSIVAVG